MRIILNIVHCYLSNPGQYGFRNHVTFIYNITHASYANPAELILSLVLTVYVIN